MLKKILLITAIAFAFVPNNAFAQEEYVQKFYVNAVKDKIEANWLRPENINGKSAVVKFTVDTDGSILNAAILRSSDNDNFDKSVLRALYKAVPFDLATKYDKPVEIELYISPLLSIATAIKGENDSNIVNVSNTNPYIDFSQYTANLEKKLNENWKPLTLKKERSAIVSLNIGKDGSLGDFKIVKTSRSKKFDTDILYTISDSVPYDSFPENINADNTDIQLVFTKTKTEQSVKASVVNVKGYDKYIGQVEKILANALKEKRYYFHKDLTVELKINKVGKLKYVKMVSPSTDKNFNRKILAVIQKTSFPPVPEVIPFDDVTLKYQIVTQKEYNLRYFVIDYMMNFARVELKPFGLKEELNSSGIYDAGFTKNEKASEVEYSSDTAYFKPYMKELQKRIKSNWSPKKYPQSKNIVTTFNVDKNGEIKDIEIVKSSGDDVFDADALNAISMSTPVDKLPQEFKGDSVKIQFSFDYNVHRANYVRKVKN